MQDVFCVSGSPVRLQKLEKVFDRPPRYGKGLDWTGYTIHDATSILLRFLLRLPEPVIPLERYEAFQAPLMSKNVPHGHGEGPCKTSFDHDATILEYQHQVTLLPPLSRQLLLYLLDLLAVFASKSDINNMTSTRLAAVFQPAILSSVKADEDFIEEEASRRLSQDVIIFLIENQEHFLIGWSRDEVLAMEGRAQNLKAADT